MKNNTTFAALQLCEPIQQALREKNYIHPSPIQAQTIPHLLANRDVIGCAQTGTGKTAAFALPILHRLHATPWKPVPGRARALILSPTRELAAQIAENFQAYGKHLKLSCAVVFGGVGQHPQVRQLSRGVDVLVATPGRLLDLERQRHLKLDATEIFVLDEADRMLDMGFINDVRKIISKLPKQRQSLLFSATMSSSVETLAHEFLRDPVKVEVTPTLSNEERIEQSVCFVDRKNKSKLLLHFLAQHQQAQVLVFVRTKHGVDHLVEHLEQEGVRAESIHGNKSQGARAKALQNFRAGRAGILVATDIAARGIDVKGIALVVNFDIPEECDAYTHRIGRTARAGMKGIAVSFCDARENHLLRSIERAIRQSIPVLQDHPFVQQQSERRPRADSGLENKRGFLGRRRTAKPRRAFRS